MVQAEKMKVLLVGASGFIGKNFIEYAPKGMGIIGIYNTSNTIQEFVREKRLSNVKLYKCDLTSAGEVKSLFSRIGKDFEYCLYLASNVNVPLSVTNPAEDIKKTVFGLLNFLQSCNKINRLVYMSTTGVYDGLKGHVDANSKLNPIVPYCISKYAAEQYIKFFHSAGRIGQFAIIRFGGAFGKHSMSKFISSLVEDICIKNKKAIEVYGDGTNIINVMYAKDAVKALVACLRSKKSNITCNLGLDNMTVAEAVNRVARAFNKQVTIRYTPKIKAQKYITFKFDSDFNKIFSFKPDYSFEEGIKEFAKALKNEN